MSENKKITVQIKENDLKTVYCATGGQSFSLKNFKGKNLVLYFYPKDHTPGCTQEGLDFSSFHKEFLKCNTFVFGISRDGLKSHESFKSKQKYKIDLISDPEEKLCRLFKVLEKMDGKPRLIRSTFILDGKSRVVYEERKVKVKGHAQSVLEFVQTHLS